jgi:hypothetical protein
MLGCWGYIMTGYECAYGLKVEVKESRVEVLGSFHRISSDHEMRLFIITDRHPCLWRVNILSKCITTAPSLQDKHMHPCRSPAQALH